MSTVLHSTEPRNTHNGPAHGTSTRRQFIRSPLPTGRHSWLSQCLSRVNDTDKVAASAGPLPRLAPDLVTLPPFGQRDTMETGRWMILRHQQTQQERFVSLRVMTHQSNLLTSVLSFSPWPINKLNGWCRPAIGGRWRTQERDAQPPLPGVVWFARLTCE